MIMQPTKNASFTIVAIGSGGAEVRYDLRANEGVFVGRSGNCGLKLPDVSIADIHCRIEFDAGKLWIQDWMSNGGTRVNGESIWTKVEVQNDAEIRIGEHILSFINNDCDSAPAAKDCFEPDVESAVESQGEIPNDLFDLDVEFFDDVDGAHLDNEVIGVMQAELDQLRAELAVRDSSDYRESDADRCEPNESQSDDVLLRMQELIDEANKSDERVSILEEILHAAEDANRAEQEERTQLEAWVADIETRIGQREDEHAAEIELVRSRLDDSVTQQEQLQRRLQSAASDGNGTTQYEETLEELQRNHQELQDKLQEVQTENLTLQKRIDQSGDSHELMLREERAKIAQEQAKVSRLRFELTSKLTAIEELPKSEHATDQEAASRIHTLRQHLKEIHAQEQQDEQNVPLTTKLARLWKRVEA